MCHTVNMVNRTYWRRHFGFSAIVRIFHTGLCIAIFISLLVQDTGLKWSLIEGNDIPYSIAFMCVLITSLVLYYTACLTDPGYVSIQQFKQRSGETTLDIEDDSEEELSADKPLDKRNRYKYRFCDYCEIQPPLRSKHCEDCKLCVRKYDHHCPWLETCIGERNHKYFWWFLFITSILIIWTFVIVWESFVTKKTWTEWFHVNIVLFLDTVVLVIGTPVVCGLLIFHTYLMMNGLTTWEAASRERITYLKYLDDDYNPFNEGCCINMYHFHCRQKIQEWETMYSKKAKLKQTHSGV
ncbi:DHHC palmitoyltransferase [Mactra antiquata]